MNFGRLLVMGLVVWLAPSTNLFASERPVVQSTFHDWSSYSRQFNLNDGTVLNEFVAVTHSGSLANNRLEISFIPRFDCVPLISMVIATYVTSGAALPSEISAKIDERIARFPVLVDEEEEAFRYSYSLPGKGQALLLEQIDSASRMSFRFDGNVSASVDPSSLVDYSGVAVAFSLLGSRKAGQAALASCRNHKPVPYEPQ